jgi:UDPglucose--hexose-1-phosphate uridylyltransferase
VNVTESRVRVTRDRLADGREILYFDESETRSHPRDRRHLPPQSNASTTRFGALLGEWVTIAAHRQERTHLPPDDPCPLCPSRPGRTTEIPAEDYDVVVFENRYPPDTAAATGGRCEVVCFTSDHEASFSRLRASRVRTVVEAWIARTATLSRLPHVQQVFCFENRGAEIGVTLTHPHGQIYAYPFVVPRTVQLVERARGHNERTGSNLYADLFAGELEQGERVVLRGVRWSAFVPFAARWPVEIHLAPHRRVRDLPELDQAERSELSHLYLELLRRLETVCGRDVPYVATWHQAPVRRDRDLTYLHLQLFSIRRAPGKLKYLAGSESAMGAFVNDLAPEQTAPTLSEALP